MPAPIGNQNAVNGKRWRSAIDRALANRSLVDQQDALELVAMSLIDKAVAGDLEAIKVLGDRLDGKAAQSLSLTGEDGGAINVVQRIERLVVDPCPKS